MSGAQLVTVAANSVRWNTFRLACARWVASQCK